MNFLRPRLAALILAVAFASAALPAASHAGNIAAPGVGKQDCTYTIGYWKTHPDQWPVMTLTLGTITYNASQLQLIFNQPVQGNGLVSLSQQLIAAKFNVAQGASDATVAATITQADALIANKVCPPIGVGSLPPGQTSAMVTTLDLYNTGNLGVPHCGTTTAARVSTWGSLKSFYR
ncbi:MAG: hypothetical protein HZA61_08295 [Candidatus Eisenbacteria bacterium]|uniref:Uncharacterized protein n=1 Tax=Eiseniibacteriota bacterium TaxID=2212470 RepID=A0A933SBJ1_UNCEI|nr:hypothetical protein [Candidatus Eisenbacteria bacterium]